MKLKEILERTTTFFKDKKFPSPRLDAELLISHGLKLERIQLYLRFDQPMAEEELALLRELVRRRGQGEPVAYILGYRDFYKFRFAVSPAVLIPRPETEHVVEEALSWAKDNGPINGIVDLGCGSGCIGLSLLKELPMARLVAVDISREAIEVAKQNAEALGLSDRVCFVHADASQANEVLERFRHFVEKEKIDILVSNPPYIACTDPQVEENVKKFEPSSALFAAEDGLALLKDWAKLYASHLNVPGIMLMEMGASQGPAMLECFAGLKTFNEMNVVKDLAGHDRVVRGVTHG